MPDIRIHPDELRNAVANMDGAAAALRGATTHLTAARDSAQATFRQRGQETAYHKVETTARQWEDEFNLIAELLTAYRDVLVDAGQFYAEADAVLGGELRRAAGGGAPADG